MYIDIDTKLTFGKYIGKSMKDNIIPLDYWLYLKNKTSNELSQKVLEYIDKFNKLYNEKHFTNTDDDENYHTDKSNDKSFIEDRVCGLCGEKHLMACGYY